MKPEQIEKRLSWLDEQHRKDSETIHRLTERLTVTEENLSKQSQQFQEISSEVARLAGMTARIHKVDEAISKHRQEISRQLGEAEKRRTKKEKTLDDLRKGDHRTLATQIEKLRDEIQVIDEIQQTLDNRREEEIRISRNIDTLEKQLEDFIAKDEGRARSIISIEEGRKRDGRRMGEMQAYTSDLRMKVDNLQGGLDTNEDRIRRLDVQLSDLTANESERREIQSLWIEQQNLKLVEFERSWKEWENRFGQFEKRATDLDERMLSYEETYRALKQTRLELDEMLERLERRINEITEMQRLAEDRLKQEWSGFQSDDQKRWNTYKLTIDEHWREHDRMHEKYDPELEIIRENADEALRLIGEIKEMDQQRMLEIYDVLRVWATEVERRTGTD